MTAPETLARLTSQQQRQIENAKASLRKWIASERAKGTPEAAIRAAMQVMDDWRPWETAPTDGTQFQVWLTDEGSGRSVLQCWQHLCRFNEHGQLEIWGRIDYDVDGWSSDWNDECQPTHWMPLPSPPKTP